MTVLARPVHRLCVWAFALAAIITVRCETASATEVGQQGAEADGPAVSESLDAYFEALWPEARELGLERALYDEATRGLTTDPRIIELLQDQPEHARAIWEYLGFAVSDNRITNGQGQLSRHSSLLDAIEVRYGVDRQVLVAIWGLETSYGENLGRRSVIRSLATLALKGGHRADFGRNQLLAAFEILKRGDATPKNLVGSWAGAMGHTQFYSDHVQRLCGRRGR